MTATLDILTASRMRTFRDCARRHDLAYVQGYRPVREADALRFGSLIHRGLEAYWRAIAAWGVDSTILSPDALGAALGAVATGAADPFEQVRAEEMLRAYAMRWAGDPMELYVLGVEAQFMCPLLNPETMAASRTWMFGGKVDVIVRRRSDDRVLVIEHKTTSDDVGADDTTYWTKLAIDPQISGYVLGAEALGHQVDEVLYDVLEKPRARPYRATPIESRKYTKDGKLYAAQREEDESVDDYRLRVADAIAGRLTSVCVRRSIPRMESQIQDFMADAWAQAGAMRDAARLGRSPRNVEACHRFGSPCPYWSLCSTGSKPEDYPFEFVKIENVHPELQEAP